MRATFAVATALLIATPAYAADVSPGCVRPFSALAIGQSLAKQRVGSNYQAVTKDLPNEEMTSAVSGDKRIGLMAFGCRGDFQDELAQEDKEIQDGQYRPVRYTNDEAMVIVVFTKPPTARESAITRATLASLSGN